MKLTCFIILFSLSPLFTLAQTMTLSRGEDAVLQVFSENTLHKAYKELGIDLKIIHVPIGRSLVLANNGVVDGDVSRISGIEKQFTNLIKIPVPVNHIDIRMFTHNQKLLLDINEFNNTYRIGCVRGIILVEKIMKKANLECVMTNNYKQAIQLLNNNKVDVLIVPLTIGTYFMDTNSQFSSSHYGESLGREPLFHYVHKKHKALVPKLTSVLQNMEIDIHKKNIDNLKSEKPISP